MSRPPGTVTDDGPCEGQRSAVWCGTAIRLSNQTETAEAQAGRQAEPFSGWPFALCCWSKHSTALSVSHRVERVADFRHQLRRHARRHARVRQRSIRHQRRHQVHALQPWPRRNRPGGL